MSRWLSLLIKEFRDLKRFFCDSNVMARRLVFYSERDVYYRFFEGYIDYILSHSDLDISYITSDPCDPILKGENPRIKPFYFSHFLRATILRLDAKALVMTMPDLGLFHIKRSINDVNHVYVFHGVGSIHLQYNKGAFDHYDTLFCIGPRDYEEIRSWEKLYNTKPKMLVQCGYPLIEKIYADHQRMKAKKKDRPKVLIAPSWHSQNILEFCLDELIQSLRNSNFDVIFRPHPEYVKRKRDYVKRIGRKIQRVANMELELELLSGTSIHEADVLVTDWSAISFEYAFGTERPVLFINTPCKIHNQDYTQLGMEPIEFSARGQLGISIDKDEVADILSILHDFLKNREKYCDRIIACREETLYHWMNAAKVGGDFLIQLCT